MSFTPTKLSKSPLETFFVDCNQLSRFDDIISYQVVTLQDEESEDGDSIETDVPETSRIHCGEMGCQQDFMSHSDYQQHYESCHRHVCFTCRKNFGSNHLLDLHISENHDPFFHLLLSKRPMYRCFVESCGESFPDSETRKNHLCGIHKFPADYKFGFQTKKEGAAGDVLINTGSVDKVSNTSIKYSAFPFCQAICSDLCRNLSVMMCVYSKA